MDQMLQNRIFRLMPRNRLTSNNMKKGDVMGTQYQINEQDSFVCK